MREYSEQGKKNEKKSGKIKGKISESIYENLEDEFQPESRFEENDELENNFVPMDESPNSSDIIENSFEPIDDSELNQKHNSSSHPDEVRRIMEEKQSEEIDKNYIKEKYDNKGKPIEIIKETSKENSKLIKNDKKHPAKKFKINQRQKIGSISELSLIRDLERNGKNVSIPYGDFQRYDLLFEEKGKIGRVQVKTTNKYERFPIQSSSSKGGTKSYKGEIDYFGVYNKNNQKSYLIPMSEIERRKNITSVKIDDSIKNRFELKNKNLNGLKGEKLIDSVINKMIHLTREDKVVLAQLGRIDENVIIYDSIIKEDSNHLTHKIKENVMETSGKTKEINIKMPNRIEIARLNVAADLMSKGYIISSPFNNNSNYDFIIQHKYAKNSILEANQLFRVKIFENNTLSNKDDMKNQNFDYVGIYNDTLDKSYLMSLRDYNKDNNKYKLYEIRRKDNILKEMTSLDRGDATEMRVAAEFINHGYNVYHPIVGRPSFDLIVKKKNEFYTIEVKTGRIFKEKDSTYIRYDISQWKNKNKNRFRGSYKDKVDFIASANQDDSKSYIVPVNILPKTDAKLKLDRRVNMRMMHHGTLWAEDYEFSKVDNIVREFKSMKNQKETDKKINQDIENLSPEKRKIIESTQIIEILKGNKKVRDFMSINSIFMNYIDQFKKVYPKSNIEYQGVLCVNCRDFLISQPDLKPIINNYLKENNLYGKGEVKHQIVYDFCDMFYYENKRGPNSLELYQTFLNFKSHELRSKLRIIRKANPHYYSTKRNS